jgi:DNA-binding NarL/FixJ family response regulator
MTSTGTALLDRDSELGILIGALDEAGHVGRCAIVTGEAGIGKSALLKELGDEAHRRDHLVFRGAGAEFDVDVPFAMVTDAFDDYLRSLDPSAVGRLARDRQGALAVAFPSLQSIDGAVEYPVSATERFRVHRAIAGLVERLAVRQPVVIILDDLHWADVASLELATYLTRHPPQAPVVVALGARLGQGTPTAIKAVNALVDSSNVEHVGLRPLTADAIGTLVSAVGPADSQSIFHLSGGNPFYALQIARGGTWPLDSADIDGGPIPPPVARSIDAELQRLSSPSRAFVEAAAVVGDPFELDLAIAASGVTEVAALGCIDELVTSQLVKPTGSPRRFAFRHPLVRNAIYHAAPAGARLTRHRRLAEALRHRGAAPAQLAIHVQQSAAHGDAAAIATLRQAGHDTSEQAPAIAVRWFTAALELLPGPPGAEHQELLTAMAASQAVLGELTGAHQSLEATIRIDRTDVSAIVACADLERLLGRHSTSQTRLLAAYESFVDEQSPNAARLMVALAMNALFVNDTPGMLDWSYRALHLAEHLGDDGLLASALTAAATGAALGGEITLAVDLERRACLVVDAMSDDELVSQLPALGALAAAEMYIDLFEDSCRHARRGLGLARSAGRAHLASLFVPSLGTSLTILGQAEAILVLDEAIEAARVIGSDSNLSMYLYNRAVPAVLCGEIDLALELTEESLDLATGFDDGLVRTWAGAVRADALLEKGDAAAALELLIASTGGDGVPGIGGGWRCLYLEVLARCCLETGDVSRARLAAGRSRDLADDVGLDLAAMAADRIAARIALADHQPSAAIELAASAVAHAQRLSSPPHAARSERLVAQACLASGRRDDAISAYRAAVETFDGLGATRYRDEIEAELRRLGEHVPARSRRRGTGSVGVEALSGRESEVAALIRLRRTNREIAEELFLGLKTVETHVRHIFDKLGCTNRRDVAAALDAVAAPA